MRIAIVAGETSGDQLGAGLIEQLKKVFPQASFYGIGGPKMQSLGFNALYQMEDISMIGLDGVFTKLPRIINIRRNLLKTFVNDKPSVFIGIDVPDFNLGLEKKLTKSSIDCVHYVSPTIWAWRKNRIHTIKQAVRHMLVLFPFEVDLYQQQNIPVTFVGHPIANEIDDIEDQQVSRKLLGLSQDARIIGLLPGSRQSEIQRHAELFLKTAESIALQSGQTEFVISAVNEHAKTHIQQILNTKCPDLKMSICTKNVRQVISASDLLLAASGTVTLETALMQKPLVMAYKVSKLSEFMVKYFSQVKYYAMPNFLLDKPEIPEFVQEQANVSNLTDALLEYLNDEQKRMDISRKFAVLKDMLQMDSNAVAAQVIKSVVMDKTA